LGERGLVCPLLVISDGAPGLIGAVDRTMGAALRQRCLIHRARINRPSRPESRRRVGRGVAA
ncbi:transposase, partial [Mycobacterium nebraskense]|uniref:transposase n=1 Tax=Mycobacterium nebraskense TaxID=244292 RepID=UPI000617B978